MGHQIRAVDAQPGMIISAVGKRNGVHTFPEPLQVVEHYRPFALPGQVCLTLSNGQVIRAQIETPVTVEPPKYS